MKIEFRNVGFSYTSKDEVLNDVSFTIPEGQMVAIIGHNGSGKSTIAKLMVGILGCGSGSILINDQVLTEKNIDNFRAKMGIVFQNPDYQFVGSTVRDDIAFGLENHLVPREEMIARIDKYSKLVKMEAFLDRSPEQLSGGQKQRVCIAGGMAMETEVMIFDESTSMLDPQGTNEVMEMIYQLKEQKQNTIVLITHNLAEIVGVDRVIALHKGNIILDGTAYEVLKEAKTLRDIGLQTLESIDLIEAITNSTMDSKQKEELVKVLWELTFQM